MRIEVRGKNVEVTDELREVVTQRFQRVGKQVSEFATLEVELAEERNPRISELAEDIRRQVKKHREKRRKRHRTRKMMQRLRGETA